MFAISVNRSLPTCSQSIEEMAVLIKPSAPLTAVLRLCPTFAQFTVVISVLMPSPSFLPAATKSKFFSAFTIMSSAAFT